MLLQMASFHSFNGWVMYCMYHVFFICSSVDGHLDCFHVLAIVSGTAMNIEVHITFEPYFPLDICLLNPIRISIYLVSHTALGTIVCTTGMCEVKSFSRVWLCDPMDCSLLGSSTPGILQAGILEWVAISFSRRSSQPRDWIRVSCIAGRCFTIWATRIQ